MQMIGSEMFKNMKNIDMVDTLLVQLIKHKIALHDLSDDSLTALDNRLAELRMVIGFETEGRKILK